MKKFSSKRRGFTLVELLIVIVVIGILSAMMMMSSTEAVTSAKASNIVSNLRNLKTAALALYVDYIDVFTKNPTSAPKLDEDASIGAEGSTTSVKSVMSYMGQTDIPEKANYGIAVSETDGNKGSWFVICEITGTKAEQDRIKEKLKGRTNSLGLLAATGKTTAPTVASGSTTETKYDGEAYVALKIR